MNGMDRQTENRRHARKVVRFEIRILVGDRTITGHIVNISAGGARLEVDEAIREHPDIVLSIERFGDYEAKVVWTFDRTVGIKFTDDPTVMADVVGAMAMYGPA